MITQEILTARLQEQAPHRSHMAGATLGEEHIAPLKEWVDARRFESPPGEITIIDFGGIESATGSYLKATVLQPLLWAGAAPAGASGVSGEPLHHFYPVIIGLNDEVRDSLTDILALRRLFCLEAIEWEQGVLAVAQLIGGHDRFVQGALKTLENAGAATAAELQGATGGSISVTGWNNRLYDLYRLRIVRRFKRDRQWIYEPLAHRILVDGE